jgi:hypothetical protein
MRELKDLKDLKNVQFAFDVTCSEIGVCMNMMSKMTDIEIVNSGILLRIDKLTAEANELLKLLHDLFKEESEKMLKKLAA